MIPNDPELYMKRKARLIKDLKSHAIPGKDEKYAELLIDNGIYKLQFLNQAEEAKKYFEEALYYAPGKEDA